jgi:hypothetical protein
LKKQALALFFVPDAHGSAKKRVQVSDLHLNEPTHTHVFKAGKQVVINLGDERHRVSVRENKNMEPKNVVKALEIAADYQGYLLEKWSEYHG